MKPTQAQLMQSRRLRMAYNQNPTPEGLKALVEFGKANGMGEQGDPEVYDETPTPPATESDLSPLELAIEQAETVSALRESGQADAADKVAALTPEQYKQARSQ